MLYAFDHLYMMGNRQLTRAKVLPDGTLTEFLAEMAGGGEHGPHSIIVSPDGKASCNCRKRNKSSQILFKIPTNWKDDAFLQNYAYGHMSQGKARRLGHEDEPRWEWSWNANMGYRNPCDFALNRDGSISTMPTWNGILCTLVPSHSNKSRCIRRWEVGGRHPRNGENISRHSRISWDVDLAAPQALLQERMQFPLIIVMHSLFVTGPLRPCIPFTSNLMVLLTGKREFISNSNGSLALTMLILVLTVTCTFAGGRGGQSYLYRVSYKGAESTELSSWIQPANMPKHGPHGVCLKLSRSRKW